MDEWLVTVTGRFPHHEEIPAAAAAADVRVVSTSETKLELAVEAGDGDSAIASAFYFLVRRFETPNPAYDNFDVDLATALPTGGVWHGEADEYIVEGDS